MTERAKTLESEGPEFETQLCHLQTVFEKVSLAL